MSEAIQKAESKSVEFVPYGSQDKIKLSILMVQDLIAVKTRSGKTCSQQDAIKFMAMCQAKRINPFEGDCFLIGYDTNDGPKFSLVTAHQTYLKRAELHPEFDGMKSGIIVKEDGATKELEGDFFEETQKVVGGWATVYFKGRKQPMHKRLRLQRFQKQFGIWLEDPAGMICKCAEADALRSSFPTMLGGLYLREEVEINPKPVDAITTPIFNVNPAITISNEEQKSPPEENKELETLVKSIEKKCGESKIEFKVIAGFIFEMGMVDTALTEIREFPIDVLRMVDTQWKDMVERINGGQK
jgi:phage recombination protein Bet